MLQTIDWYNIILEKYKKYDFHYFSRYFYKYKFI